MIQAGGSGCLNGFGRNFSPGNMLNDMACASDTRHLLPSCKCSISKVSVNGRADEVSCMPKEVEATLDYAESKGWRIEVGGGHAWGKMYCP
jgi:hypothetical protein